MPNLSFKPTCSVRSRRCFHVRPHRAPLSGEPTMTIVVDPQASKPTAVRWMTALAWIRIVISVFGLGLAIVFASPLPDSSTWLGGVRDGFAQRAGYKAGEFGAYQMGEMLADLSLAAAPAALIILFVARRNLTGLRIVAAVYVLLSLPNVLAWPLSVATLVLAFQRSTRAYCRAPSASEPSAA